MEQEGLHRFSLKVLVAKEENKVLFAESNSEFIDVLFSFMTMPIGSIIRLTRELSTKREIGCLNNLYESVEVFDDEFLQSQECRDILLYPRSAAEIYCRNLKMNLIERGSNEYFVCRCRDCNWVSYCQLADCNGVFVKPTARFMITDDFQVMSMSTMNGLTLLSKLGANGTIEERTLNIGREEVLKLLKCSLTSRTPLSDTFLEHPISKTSSKVFHRKYGPRSMDPFQKVEDSAKKGRNICFKLIVNKAKNRALYAEVKEDFVNLLCSFLAFPLGYVFEEFPCLSFKGCMGNLYKSIQDTDINLFLSERMKKTLLDLKLAPGLAYDNQLIGIKEASICSKLSNSKCLAFCSDPHQGEAKIGKGIMKGPSVFMVMDNLAVKPLSPMSAISLINKLQVPFIDIEEQEVTMGKDEALRLLVASLASKYALTDAFLLKKPKEPTVECWEFLLRVWEGMGKMSVKDY